MATDDRHFPGPVTRKQLRLLKILTDDITEGGNTITFNHYFCLIFLQSILKLEPSERQLLGSLSGNK